MTQSGPAVRPTRCAATIGPPVCYDDAEVLVPPRFLEEVSCRPTIICRTLRGAAPMDVGEWLRGLGLAQYEQAFRDNDIDSEVLHRLTVDDLRDLGITSVGHRRRFLDALDALAK